MSYIGSKPAAAPLTSSDVTDGIITNAKLAQDIISADTALAVAPADTDELLISDAGTLKRIDYSLIKASPGLVHLYTATATGASEVAVSSTYITSTYEWYKIFLRGKPATDSVQLKVRFQNSGSDVTDNYDFGSSLIGANDPGYSLDQDHIVLNRMNVMGNAANEGFTACIDFTNPQINTIPTRLIGTISYGNTSDANRADHFFGRRDDGTETHDGIRFFWTSGNFAEVTINVLGVKKS
jgi:hypothetical protein